jgi:hypothetical protein
VYVSCSQIHSPLIGDKVDSGIGLSYRPVSLCSLSGRYDNTMPESTLSPQSKTMNLAFDIDFGRGSVGGGGRKNKQDNGFDSSKIIFVFVRMYKSAAHK